MLMLIASLETFVPDGVNFNTSHVNVNHSLDGDLSQARRYFNTSHVNVNLNRYAELDKPFTDFNTSHVNVNLVHACENIRSLCISIHLMLMLIL